VIVLLGAGALIRAIYLLTPGLDSDEAVVGLMAIHILEGEFPIFYWGEPYCGPLESFLASILFFLLGPSRTALNLAPAVVSLCFLVAAWRFAAAAFGQRVGLVSLLFLAVGPAFLVWHSVLARGNYIENLLFGAVLMALVVRILQAASEAARWRGLCIFAFLAGVAWWVSFQSVHFLLAGGLVLLAGLGRSLLDRRALAAVGFALLGSLLFWIYNLQHDFASLVETGRYMAPLAWGLSLKLFFLRKLPSILGMPMTEMARVHSPGLNFALMALYLAAALAVLGVFLRRLAAGGSLRAPEFSGMAVLLAFTAVASLIILARYNSGGVVRYFLVFYASLPILLALALVSLFPRWPTAALVAGGFVTLVNVTGSVAVADAVHPLSWKGYSEGRAREAAVIRGLRERGIRAVFVMEYWEFFGTNFDGSENPVFAMPRKAAIVNKYWPYTDYALAQEDVPYLWHGSVDNFRSSLRAIGARYTEEAIGPYTLFSKFRPVVSSLEEIAPDGWRVEVPAGADQARFMIDLDPATHWGSGAPQEAGWTIRVDLGRVENVAQVVLEPGPVPPDVPAEFEIRTSRDGREWETAVPAHPFTVPLMWRGNKVVFDDRDVVRGIFHPRPSRFVEIRLTKGKPFHWRVSELSVYRGAASE
jgi:hypothetical protein